MNLGKMRPLLCSVLFLFAPPEALPSDNNSLKLHVEGMHCQSCVSMIKKTVKKVPGVESVTVDLEKGVVEVVGDSLQVREARITETIEKMGYDVLSNDSPRSDSLEVKKD